MKSVKSSSDLQPGTTAYAILTFSTVYIPGDERSRTNPGHGYPASTETTSALYVCKDEEEWLSEIEKRGKYDYVIPMKIQVPSCKKKVEWSFS